VGTETQHEICSLCDYLCGCLCNYGRGLV
jgi:hypothetical protein